MTDKAPPMVPGDAASDRAYLDAHGIHAALAAALARVVREKPDKPLQLIAQMISPETQVAPASAAEVPAPAAGEPAAPS